jgi:hypothetical protein
MADEGLAASLAATAANGLPWDRPPPVYPAGAAFGTGSPAEEAQQPAGLAALLGGLYNSLGGLAKRSFGASEEMRQGEAYNPAPAVEAAMTAMTGGVGGTGAGGVALGAGPIRAAKKVAGAPAAPIAEQLGKTISVPVLGPTSDVSLAKPYISNPQRIANPGVYKRPDEIAAEAAANVAPEHPALKQLFGVTRDDLYGISQQGRRQGNIDPQLWAPSKASKPNEAAAAVMNPANAQRIVDALSEASKYPELVKGMVPWYVMDPAYQRMAELVGPERAAKEYHDFNMTVSPFSAGSAVPVELNRGTAANMMRMRGEYPAFQQSGGMPPGKRPEDIRDLLAGVQGHLMHKEPAKAVARYIETGEHGFDQNTVKIPLYAQASGVPQTGFQTKLPVPDTHFASAIGMPEARTSTDFRGFMQGPEYRQVGPWFRENVARPMNMEAVPAQAFTWGTYGPQTGVRTNVGAGKLELLAQNIWERAKKLGVDPAWLRDQVLTGKGHASILATGGLGGLLGGAALQGQNQEQRQ